ncbi:MAG TPA: prepilin-type N-terminal cleavage/methylation domain-containing protein [Pirellulales bacterium]|jgi:type II secretory pathway pseudopilin PulG|nr:prepilin-type N-terminal cleavage/methylation domain-containing protein [Pirellulales bacterium]
MDLSFKQRRCGLTLMELVVVMVILVALAGILLPLFPSMLTRAHTSSAATNMTELSKAIQTYYYQDLQLPNYLDNLAPLVNQPSPANSAVNVLAVAGGTSSTAGNDIWKSALSTNDAQMLVAAGMTTLLQTIVPPAASLSAWSPTYNPYSTIAIGNGFLPQTSTAALTITSSPTVVYVSPIAMAREFGLPYTATQTPVYVMFGVGDYSSMSGKVLQEAPIHFDDAATGQPNVSYCRFGVVFRTTADGQYDDQSAAQFVGVVDLGDDTLTTAQDHIQDYLNTK